MKQYLQTTVFLTVLTGVVSANVEVIPFRTDKPPVLDGKLTETVWQEAPPITGFKTVEPGYGKDANEKTVAYAAYDSENLYFALFCYDSEPHKVKATVSSWDQLLMVQQDWAGVVIDALNDQQTALGFIVNAYGSQADISLGASGSGDPTPDFIWEAGGNRHDEGYTIELAIPLKSLRYNAGSEVHMGLAFVRTISRYPEVSAYPEIVPEEGVLTAQLAPAIYENLGYTRTIEILPSFTQGQTWSQDGGQLVVNKDVSKSKVRLLDTYGLGVTGKVGLTPTLTMDLTLNPDFSQVESDAGQIDVNIRAPLFFSEKRPFFLEGLDNFRIGGQGTGAISRMVHTRNIIDPSAGVKITGKLGPANSVTALVTTDESPMYADQQNKGEAALFGIARYKRILKEDAFLGGMVTTRDYRGGFNRVAGIDGRIRFSGTLFLEGNALYSLTQDVGAGEPRGAHNGDLSLNYSDRNWYFGLGYHDTDTLFTLAPGYIPRDGVRQLGWGLNRKFYLESKVLKRITIGYSGQGGKDLYYRLSQGGHSVYIGLAMARSTYTGVNIWKRGEAWKGQLFDDSGHNVYFNSQILNALFISAGFSRGTTPIYSDVLQGEYFSQWGSLNFQPDENLTVALSANRRVFTETESQEELYDAQIYRLRTTYQINKHLFARLITEYNTSGEHLSTEFLMSFTYVPGTVIHLGYGSGFDKQAWNGEEYLQDKNFMETTRGIFLKASYNWRL